VDAVSPRAGRCTVLVGLTVAVLATCGLARADSVLVLVGGPAESADEANEVLNRVRGELVADGFRVEPVRAALPAERMGLVRQSGGGGPIAVGLFVGEDSEELDIVLLDTVSGRSAVRHLNRPTPREAPDAVARHAVDLLRASLLEFAIAGLRDTAASPKAETPVVRVEASGRSAPVLRWALEAGVGVVAGFAGVGVSVAPVLGLRYSMTRAFQLRLTGAGLGSSPSVQTDRGAAAVQQTIVLADGTLVLGQSRWLRPLLVFGAGVYYAGVAGTGVPPYEGVSGGGTAFALDGGIGLSTSLTTSLDLSLDARVVVAQPGIAVRFIDEDAARLGQPAVLMTLTLADWI
jgi:hypothetical protein